MNEPYCAVFFGSIAPPSFSHFCKLPRWKPAKMMMGTTKVRWEVVRYSRFHLG